MDASLPFLQRTRALRGLWLTLASGGVLLWRSARTVRAVARQAPVDAAAAHWLLVPGLRLREGDVHGHFSQRIARAYRLWQQDPTRGLILSGAPARRDARSEADAALEQLIDLGLPAAVPVLLDHRARSTLENLQRARELLAGDARSVAVVSNRYHLARIGWLARGCGLDWRLCGAEPAWRATPLTVLALLLEAAALLALAGADAARLDPATLL